jgi:hypothetical protein
VGPRAIVQILFLILHGVCRTVSVLWVLSAVQFSHQTRFEVFIILYLPHLFLRSLVLFTLSAMNLRIS